MLSRILTYLSATLLALLVAVVLAGSFAITTSRGHPCWIREHNKFQFAADWLSDTHPAAFASGIPPGEYMMDDLTYVVRDRLIPYTPDFYRRDGYRDCWKNPYMIVLENEGVHPRVKIYSTGADGITASRGNDPDDFNSWGQFGWDYYSKRDSRQQLCSAGWLAGFVSLFTVPIALLWARSKLALPSRGQSDQSRNSY